MTHDADRGLSSATWTVYGKIQSQSLSNGTTINYTYDAGGNRISKTVSGTNGYTEFYVRDASGNTMSVYRAGDNSINSGNLTQVEINLYGSSRLGTYKPNTDVTTVPGNTVTLTDGSIAYLYNFTRGNKFFELTDHRGNNLVTISDKKTPIDQDTDGLIDYYLADVAAAQDYSSFGALLDGRQTGNTPRYTYNGKQLDKELGWQEYGMREYLGGSVPVFASVDPLTPKFPELTPYQYASNRPIDGIDRDGLEYCPYIPKFSTDGRSFFDYVGAIDNGAIDVLNLVPALYNSVVANVQSIKRGTYGDDLRRDFKQTGSDIKQAGVKVWREPLKTLTSPDAVEFLVSSYIGAKALPGGGSKGNLMKPATAAKTVTTAAEEEVLLKPYGGPGGGHHIPAKSAFIGAVGYDLNTALAIPNAELARLGINHGLVTGAQMVAYKTFASTGATLTWEAMSTIETNALIKGGLNATSAKGVVTEAISDLKKAGVANPTRIPWSK